MQCKRADRHQMGKRQRERPCRVQVPTVPAQIRGQCTIHIIEVGFCCEHSFATRLPEKHRQHAALIDSLRSHGWRMHNDKVTVLLFGHAGTIFHPCEQALTDLGVSQAEFTKTMNSIHVQTVKAAQGIISARRQLERSLEQGTFGGHRRRAG